MDEREKDKLTAVILYVGGERARRGITEAELRLETLPELSCEMHGEGFNLVECQLMFTQYGFGEWRNLNGPSLELAYQYAVYGRRG